MGCDILKLQINRLSDHIMPETIGPSPDDMNARPKKETPTKNDVIPLEDLHLSASDLKDMYERSCHTIGPGPESKQDQQAIEQKQEELEAVFQAAPEQARTGPAPMTEPETRPRGKPADQADIPNTEETQTKAPAPESAESSKAKEQLQREIDKLYFAVKRGEMLLRGEQMEDFRREAAKLDKNFARNLPARGLAHEGVDYDFRDLFNHLDHEFAGRYWGSFYTQGVEEEGQRGGFGYPARDEGFMVIGTPGKPFNRENLSAILIPRHYELLSDHLRRAYPEIKFITVDEIKDLPSLFRKNGADSTSET